MGSLNSIQVGVDVGQLHDPTAICVSEVSQIETGKFHRPPRWGMGDDPILASHYTTRSIKRLPLGTSYPDVAAHLADLLCNPLFVDRKVSLLIDVTGVGRPVYEDLQAEIRSRPEARHAKIRPISFVHGEAYNRASGVLGKAYLVSRLQSLLQGGRVHAPNTPEVRATLEELRVYEIKIDEMGKDTYGAKTGKHDDLATALGLACLEDPFAANRAGGVLLGQTEEQPEAPGKHTASGDFLSQWREENDW